MAIEDYFDPYSYDDDDDSPPTITCKYCGKSNLIWTEEYDERWILIDSKSGQIHKCRNKSEQPKQFNMDEEI